MFKKHGFEEKIFLKSTIIKGKIIFEKHDFEEKIIFKKHDFEKNLHTKNRILSHFTP